MNVSMVMISPPEELIRRFGRCLALVCTVVGALVLLGWYFDIPWLKQLDSEWVSMKANTALGFVIAGLALYQRHQRVQPTQFFYWAAGLLTLLGLLTLAEYLLNSDFGIDQWLFQDNIAATATSHAGRMAPATALSFIFLGLAMMLWDSTATVAERLASGLVYSILLIAFLVVLGYGYSVQSLYRVQVFTAMALHTAFVFIALSISLLSLNTERGLMRILASPMTGGRIARRLLPVIVVLPLVLGWLRLEGQHLGWYDTNFGVALTILLMVLLLTLLVLHHAQLLNDQDSSLQMQNRLQTLILDSMSEGVVVIDTSGQFQVFNPAAEAIVGLGSTQTTSTEWNHYFGVFYPESMSLYPPDELPLLRSLAGVTINNETQFIRNPLCPEGVFINVSSRPLRNEQSQIIGAVAVFHDITEKRRTDEALAQALTHLAAQNKEIAANNKALEQTGRLKSEFLANMSHELRTPLNAIIGFSEVLKDGLAGPLSDKQAEYVEEVFDGAQHLLALINDILDLSKVEAGKLELETETVAVAKLLQDSLSIIKEKALQRHITLSLEISAAPQYLIADARKLKQIVYNLLSNAVKFTPDGGQVSVSARVVSRDAWPRFESVEMTVRQLPLPDNDWQDFLDITVCDSGIGIAAVDLARLFQPFMQVDASLARNFEGTGLGLMLVKRMAELHGGTVAVASALGQGTCFSVCLPYRRQDNNLNMVSPSQPESGHGLHAQAAAATKTAQQVLIIEDNKGAAEILRLYLQNAGFGVAWAVDAEQGLAMVTDHCPDLIILDLLLPQMSGWEVLERLKASPVLAHIPVVIVSIVAERQRGFALGAAQVLNKPLQRVELLAALNQLGFGSTDAQVYTVLAVDDDPSMHSLLTSFLSTEQNCSLHCVHSGREALDQIHQAMPDLLILDLMMPGLSGFDVIDVLKSDPATDALPILILTAKVITSADRERLNSHVLSIIEKSHFNRERFLAEVWRALRGQPS